MRVKDLKLPFNDNSYDCVFSYSVFQYLNNNDELFALLNEMKRVTKKYIYIGCKFLLKHLLEKR